MIKQYRKNKLISELEFEYESLKLYQQAKEDLINELRREYASDLVSKFVSGMKEIGIEDKDLMNYLNEWRKDK